jgi:hypothetical protein
MKIEEIKEKLHQYIDKATEEDLQEMLFLLEEDGVDYGRETKHRKWWEDEAFVKELDRRADEIESGKVKGYTRDEVEAEVKRRLSERKKNDV